MKEQKPWNKGKRLSEEHKRKISESRKGNNFRTGIRHTDETKRKIFKKFGFSTLFLHYSDLKDREALIEKISLIANGGE